MAPEKDSNPSNDQGGKNAPDVPPEVLVDTPPNSLHETSTGVDGRPELLRIEFAGPDSPIDMETVRAQRAIRYVDLTLAPEASLVEDWDSYAPAEQRMFRAAVLQELFGDTYEELEARLKSSTVVAREAGFEPGGIPSDTTLWRRIRDFDEDVVEEAARRANNAVLHATLPGGRPDSNLGTDPEKPSFYYEVTKYDRGVSTEEKMQAITQTAAEYMEHAIPHIDFDRDSNSPNYQHPPEAFYRLLAHTALEDCYPANGADLLRWLSGDDVSVPDASTLYGYADQFTVNEHAERFLNATCALFERGGLRPPEPVHLGFDITKKPWYGAVETNEDGSPTEEEWRIKSTVSDNTTWFWAIGILSITTPDRNYVLGFEPISDAKEYDQALDTMLNRVEDRLDLTFGRIYLDSGLGNTKIMDVCEEHGLNWLIQGEMNGERKKLVEKLPPGIPGGKKGVEFGKDNPRKINIFACPNHPETIQSKQSDGTKDNDKDGKRTTLSEYTDENSSIQNSEQITSGDDRSTTGDQEEPYAESEGITVRKDIEMQDGDTWLTWNTNMDVEERDLRGLAYQYRHRWRVETAIRQLKQDFTGRCGTDNPRVRAFSIGAGQLFFNFWAALQRELPYQLDHTGVQLTGLELLHGLREADFEDATARRHP